MIYLDITIVFILYIESDSVYRINRVFLRKERLMDKKKKSTPARPLSPAVSQAAQLLLYLGSQPGTDTTLTLICEAIGIHKSKGYSILNSLSEYGFVVRDGNSKTYSLGPAVIPLGARAIDDLDIHAAARGHLQALAEETACTVLLGIVSRDRFYVVGKYDGNAMVSLTIRQNQCFHITHGAHGKAIVAAMNDETREKILTSQPLHFYGENTRVDRTRLEAEFVRCRENEYAVDNESMTPGIRAVAAPVFDHGNVVFAGVVLAGMFREDEIPAMGERVAAMGRWISRQAGASI